MTDARSRHRDGWAGWRTVLWLGVVSLLVDLVYEGARSITGPFLASLGASALTVGLVTGAGEAAALGFRLFSGPAADRTGRYWRWMVVGYALTAVCVPLMALAPALGAAGLAFGCGDGAARAHRQGDPQPGQVGAARGRGAQRRPRPRVRRAQGARPDRRVPRSVARRRRRRRSPSHQWAGLLVLAVPGAVALGVLAWMHRYVGDPQHEPVPAGRRLWRRCRAPSTCTPWPAPSRPSG